jgi:hypothetical protein
MIHLDDTRKADQLRARPAFTYDDLRSALPAIWSAVMQARGVEVFRPWA